MNKSFGNMKLVMLLMLVIVGAIFYRSFVLFNDQTVLIRSLKATQEDLTFEIKNMESLVADLKFGQQTIGIRDFFQYKCQKILR
jgi:hypothetical protein